MKSRAVKTVLTLSMLGGLVISCGTEHSESCEWERKKNITITEKPKQQMVADFGSKGGTSGGRGGSSGSRGGSSGGGSKLGKTSSSGGSGGASKPRYNRSNPAPKPTSNPGKGYYWGWECD